jgi:hypothetical protein
MRPFWRLSDLWYLGPCDLCRRRPENSLGVGAEALVCPPFPGALGSILQSAILTHVDIGSFTSEKDHLQSFRRA